MKVLKSGAPDFIPLDSRRRPIVRPRFPVHSHHSRMKKNVNNGRPYGLTDRNLTPRVLAYLKENSHQRYIDVDRMSDYLQAAYPDYGRRKKLPFRQMVQKGLHYPCYVIIYPSTHSSLLFVQLTKTFGTLRSRKKSQRKLTKANLSQKR